MTRSRSPSRRYVLASLGTAIGAVAAGCIGTGGLDGEPRYEDGTVGERNASNVSNRSATEMATAEALAEREPSDAVTPLETLSLTDHEFVVEDGYLGSTVQGHVENTGSDRIQLVEVRTRVYDAAGNALGRYLASIGDLEGGETWAFQVIVLESPADVADYDITVLGTPA
ncbi:FxLYD domain-containing protein [Halopiger djelfimassiliensis]|uniref:FxLYD domain-containing protein n=1 Tax=Halopiger djelfimassiliensis TaxID=1293047 RepID=UPI000677C7D8|nr:FxLYD domain-containing protein [Halopiger djelfimassiliensis]